MTANVRRNSTFSVNRKKNATGTWDAIRYGSSNQGAMSALHAKYDTGYKLLFAK